MGEFNQAKYIQEYQKENYKRVPVDMKKHDYEIALAHSKKKGYKSFAAYIKDLIAKDIENNGNSIYLNNINQQGNNNSINIK